MCCTVLIMLYSILYIVQNVVCSILSCTSCYMCIKRVYSVLYDVQQEVCCILYSMLYTVHNGVWSILYWTACSRCCRIVYSVLHDVQHHVCCILCIVLYSMLYIILHALCMQHAKYSPTHHFFCNSCTKSGLLRFSQFSVLSVYILMSFDFLFVRLLGVW